MKVPIGRGKGVAIDTPRGTDGLCRIRWWLQNWSVKVSAVHWLQQRPKVLGLYLVPVLLSMYDSHLMGQR